MLMAMQQTATAGTLPPRPGHIDAVRKIVEAKRQDPFFKRRHAKNVESPPQSFSRDEFWKWIGTTSERQARLRENQSPSVPTLG